MKGALPSLLVLGLGAPVLELCADARAFLRGTLTLAALVAKRIAGEEARAAARRRRRHRARTRLQGQQPLARQRTLGAILPALHLPPQRHVLLLELMDRGLRALVREPPPRGRPVGWLPAAPSALRASSRPGSPASASLSSVVELPSQSIDRLLGGRVEIGIVTLPIPLVLVELCAGALYARVKLASSSLRA